MLLTVFTPTFNREILLQRVYECLIMQSYKNFEWIIVDDGSIDNTENICKEFIKEKIINITYLKQANQGKHFAFNNGLQYASGEYFVILDSDDILPVDGLQNIVDFSKHSLNTQKVAGVVGRKASIATKKIIGNNLNYSPVLSNSFDIRYKYKINGDLAEVFKTKILKNYFYPEFENEKFCGESYVWNNISKDYKLLFFNDIIYYADYLEEGLTANSISNRIKSINTTLLYYSSLEKHPIPIVIKLKTNINFWRFYFHSNFSFFSSIKRISFIFSLLGIPLGFLLFVKDKIKLKKQK